MPRDAVTIVAGLHAVASRYDVVLCDVWGVLHVGVTGFADASAALARFREGGGRVVLVSNAPRPGEAVAAQLDGFGVPRAAYDAILTSGDLTRAVVIERRHEVLAHLGPDRDWPIFEGLDLRFGGIEEAAYFVCTGLLDDERETADDYRAILERARRRDLLMICANPDLVVERGERLILCAGALAAAYEAMGGRVFYAGKPHRPVYDEALARAAALAGGAPVAPSRVLAIGDALRTDIAGANGAGLASLLVARGIHAAELGLPGRPLARAVVEDWLAGQSARPDMIMDALTWD